MRALFILGALCATLLASSARAAVVVNIPMDKQINLGITTPQSPEGNAIYIPSSFTERLSFQPDPTGGFARVSITGGSWYYGPYIDFNQAGVGPLDLSDGDCSIAFDARYFQDTNNTQRYTDAPIFLRLYSYLPDNTTLTGYRDYSIVYATQAPWNNPAYPDWTHVVVNFNDPAATTTGQNGLQFDTAGVTRMRMYGTDWYSPAGSYSDFIDVRNFSITCGNGAIPEPGTMSLLALGALPLLRLRRRKA